jgi:hypothetical protein
MIGTIFLLSLAMGSDPSVDPVDKALAVQKAMADARDWLQAGDPVAAAKVLESQLTQANVNRVYLELLAKAYHGELANLRSGPSPDTGRIDLLSKRLAVLEGGASKPKPAASASVPVSAPTPLLREATRLFQAARQDSARYADAGKLFAQADAAGETLTADQRAAWAYCKVKTAADRVNTSSDPATASAASSDVQQALALVPEHAPLQQAGAKVLAAITPTNSESFRIVGQSPQASAILAEAARHREAISQRWFGPAGPAWHPACDLVIHDHAMAFASVTKLNERATGHAEVTLDAGRVTGRRIDLRSDDNRLLNVSLPREIAHILLAELFPTTPPPRWAEEGIAISSTTKDEVNRFKAAIPRLLADGQMPRASDILKSTGFPQADRITGFYVASVTLTDYLVSLNGEKAFISFLTDAQRYGIETALKRQYRLTPSQLDAIWTTPQPVR